MVFIGTNIQINLKCLFIYKRRILAGTFLTLSIVNRTDIGNIVLLLIYQFHNLNIDKTVKKISTFHREKKTYEKNQKNIKFLG